MFNPGNHQKQGEFSVFVPTKIANMSLESSKRVQLLTADAMRYLGELNAYSVLVPDIDFFIKMYVFKEATTSSRIEGTQTQLDEAILPKEDIAPERRDDWEEVQNYINAIHHAVAKLDELPLSRRLMDETHKVLLAGVRGYSKDPGEIRKIQVWIGGGSDIRTAAFVPPPADLLPDLLSDLQEFWNNDQLETAELVKLAFSHYQFETIHPYLDGNGRLGRLFITLQLVAQGILTSPTLYLSDYFEKHRADYYDALSQVRASGDIEQWLAFFIGGVASTAKDAKDTLAKIIVLRQNYTDRIEAGIGIRRQKAAKALLKELFGRPIVTAQDIEQMINVSPQTANELAKDFRKIGLFREATGYKKNRIYILEEYFNLFNNEQGR